VSRPVPISHLNGGERTFNPPNLASRVGFSGKGEITMKWTTPRIIEIAVGLEINAYACAEANKKAA
jgi:coenzyme PQQ precursor peptide PqqA